jgi:cobalt/nickel transport system permease protein
MAARVPFAERYLAGRSAIHTTDARAKLPATLAYIFAVTLTPVGHWPALSLLALPLAAALVLSRVPPLVVLRRSALALPFLLAAVPLMFTKEGEVLFSVPLFGWTASREGLEAVLSILAKSWLSVVAAVILTTTTPAAELLRAMRTLGLPRLLVATVSFMYRYLFVIGEEALRLLRARDSRSGRPAGVCPPGRRAGGNLGWRARVLGNMIGSLFLRTYERSERVYAAMQARGYDGEPRFLSNRAWRPMEIVLATALVAYLAGVELYARY